MLEKHIHYISYYKLLIKFVLKLINGAGLHRCGKSCRLRWVNYLRPDLKRGNFGEDEEDLIIKLHALLGNRYCAQGIFGIPYIVAFLKIPGANIYKRRIIWNLCIC